MSYNSEEIKEVRCPKCGDRMYDNRLTKRNPKAPDFKCKDRSCDGVIWPPKDGPKRGMPQPQAKPLTTQGKEPYESGPRIAGLDPDAVDPTKLQGLFTVYGLCLDHVLKVEVPKLEKAQIGASPE